METNSEVMEDQEVEDDATLAERLAQGMVLVVYSAVNRGKTVKCSLGPVEFDSDGYGEIEVSSEEDVHKVHQYGWLLASDRQRFFQPVAVKEEPEPLTDDAAAMVNEINTLSREMDGLRRTLAQTQAECNNLRAERDAALEKLTSYQRERDMMVEAGAAKAKARAAEAEKKASVARKAAAKKANGNGGSAKKKR